MFCKVRGVLPEAAPRESRRKRAKTVDRNGEAATVPTLPDITSRMTRDHDAQPQLSDVLATLEIMEVPDETTAKAVFNQKLAEINEEARVKVTTQRRADAAASLDKVLSSVISTYVPEKDTPLSIMGHKRGCRIANVSAAFPEIQETLRLVQRDRKSFASKEQYEEHMAAKLTWLIKELAVHSEKAELLEERYTRLHEFCYTKENERLNIIRRFRDLYTLFHQKISESRKLEHGYEERIAEMEETIKELREKIAHIRRKEIFRRDRKAISMSAAPVAEGTGAAALQADQPQPEPLRDDREHLVDELVEAREEIKRLRGLMDQVRSAEKERQERDAAVQKMLRSLEEERKRRQEMDQQWEKVLAWKENASSDREELQSKLRSAVAICGQKETEVKMLREELDRLQEALDHMRQIHQSEVGAHETFITSLRDDHIKSIADLERERTIVEYQKANLEERLRQEIVEHANTLERLRRMQEMLLSNPSTHELLLMIRQKHSSKAPQVQEWFRSIIAFIAESAKEIEARKAALGSPLHSPLLRTVQFSGELQAGPESPPAMSPIEADPSTFTAADGGLHILHPLAQETLSFTRVHSKADKLLKQLRQQAEGRYQMAQYKGRAQSLFSPLPQESAREEVSEGKMREQPARRQSKAKADERSKAMLTPTFGGDKSPGVESATESVSSSPSPVDGLPSSSSPKGKKTSFAQRLKQLQLKQDMKEKSTRAGNAASGSLTPLSHCDASSTDEGLGASGMQIQIPTREQPEKRRMGRSSSRPSVLGKTQSPQVKEKVQRTHTVTQTELVDLMEGRPWSTEMGCEVLTELLEGQYEESRRLRQLLNKAEEQLLKSPLITDIVSYKETYLAKQSECSTMKKIIEELRNKLDALQSELTQSRIEFTDSVCRENELRGKLAALEEEVHELKKGKTEIKRQMKHHLEAEKSHNDTVAALRHEITEERDILAKITELHQQRVAQLKEELQIEKEGHKQELARIPQLESTVEAMQLQAARLRSSIERMVRSEGDCETDFICMICLDVLDVAVVCRPCGHVFCAACMDDENGITQKDGQEPTGVDLSLHTSDGRTETTPSGQTLFYCVECKEHLVTSYVRCELLDRIVSKARLRREAVQDLQTVSGVPGLLRPMGAKPVMSPLRSPASTFGREMSPGQKPYQYQGISLEMPISPPEDTLT